MHGATTYMTKDALHSVFREAPGHTIERADCQLPQPLAVSSELDASPRLGPLIAVLVQRPATGTAQIVAPQFMEGYNFVPRGHNSI